jgi:O-antigen/teichoic acid export membrane protein
MIKKIFKESFLYTFANHAPLLVNIFILPIITPYLTANDYGIYGLALAYTGALSALANLGFIPLFQNSFFKKNKYSTLSMEFSDGAKLRKFFQVNGSYLPIIVS